MQGFCQRVMSDVRNPNFRHTCLQSCVSRTPDPSPCSSLASLTLDAVCCRRHAEWHGECSTGCGGRIGYAAAAMLPWRTERSQVSSRGRGCPMNGPTVCARRTCGMRRGGNARCMSMQCLAQLPEIMRQPHTPHLPWVCLLPASR